MGNSLLDLSVWHGSKILFYQNMFLPNISLLALCADAVQVVDNFKFCVSFLLSKLLKHEVVEKARGVCIECT